MRQEQVRGGLISSIHVRLLHLPIKICYWFQAQEKFKKIHRADTTAILT